MIQRVILEYDEYTDIVEFADNKELNKIFITGRILTESDGGYYLEFVRDDALMLYLRLVYLVAYKRIENDGDVWDIIDAFDNALRSGAWARFDVTLTYECLPGDWANEK